MKIAYSILLGLFIVQVQCTAPQQQENGDSKPSEIKMEETFDVFFENFKSDSIFQKERIVFPLERLIRNYGEELTETMKNEEWQYFNFQANPSDTDAYEIKQEVNGEGMDIVLRGIDNGILISFSFLQKEGKWFLVREKDESM